MGIKEDIERLRARLKKLEALTPEDIWTCKGCGETFQKTALSKGPICYTCEQAELTVQAKKEAEKKILGALIKDLELHDHDPTELREVIIQKGETLYRINVGGWEEHYLYLDEL